MKKCCRCKRDLPETEFHRNKRQKDGLCPYCKKCRAYYDHKYIPTKKTKNKKKEYAKNHRDSHRLSNKKYRQTEKGKQAHKRAVERRRKLGWSRSEKTWQNNRLISKRIKAERKGMKFIQVIDNPFPKEISVEYHHVNNLLVMPLPKRTHKRCIRKNVEEHRRRCNEMIEKIYCLDLGKILTDKKEGL